MQVKNLYIQLPEELWKRVEEARWALRAETKTEAVKLLLENALKCLEKKKAKSP